MNKDLVKEQVTFLFKYYSVPWRVYGMEHRTGEGLEIYCRSNTMFRSFWIDNKSVYYATCKNIPNILCYLAKEIIKHAK